mmetsp:Transcript_46670/g.47139  ORF Transcript_46670/g.47139 Transcript_46670/m.47139 type:complete len:301 (-) Transcript_46670:342-1244(-)|eukprot:CAMPEP_0171299840 /NCGR_PEP_ID=MMETSP0816-20121228/8706_1 /TAXON_ID=420281 /ORGANISM="Proboscia inermis, Strain CCAP1064/1" /LENGTH=300 /DNA_ID=CAMNT_0011775971 /DNA_START=135 /DNA_END=1037 /DNA_ORIENTATION=-
MTFSDAANGQCLATANGHCVNLGLSSVPETTLWTLHNRVSVASDLFKDWFVDDKAVEIYRAIDYDYERSFGKANESHGIRSWLFDQGVLEFWKKNPGGGTIVNFAEGLETQRFRPGIIAGRPEGSLWITVDLPPAIKAREQFIMPDDENLHVTASVLDTGEWMHLVPKDKPVFFTAQGLFMYLEEEDTRVLFQKMAKEFPSSSIWFDSIAKWLSQKTMSGLKLTDHYQAPPMPFGANKNNAPGVFKSWVPNMEVEEVPWPFEMCSSFFFHYVSPILINLPYIQNAQPGMVFNMTFPPSLN